ncbi:MAG: MlaD family protein, partial [Solirubrobacterales bacterium]
MRRVALILASIAAAAGGVAAGADADDDAHTYRVEMYNAFGLVTGSDVRVAGVNVGSITDLTVNEHKRAVVTVELEGDLTRLGDETGCESSPQSLIAEYFLDCQPAGEPLPEGGMIPATQVKQTVQPDIVANTMREPFRRRLTLLINEFGTALAGNPEALREAVRLGAPALTEFEEATEILANHAKMIRAFNVHSEKVSRELAAERDRIVEFVDEAEDVASTALERREDVSRGFDLFDDYIAELRPTLTQLNDTARHQTPLLADLREAAPELHRLSINLPTFQRASEDSLRSLGKAAVVGRRALTRGRDELELLAEAGKHAPVTAEMLADLLRDIDDPRRATEINDLAEASTGRTGEQPGTGNTKGYTGLEGLLNYAYYQALGINQFDRGGHALHVNLYEYQTGPCGSFSAGRNPATGEPGIPAADGGTTTDFLEIARCATWLGPNQPGINDDPGLGPYDASVCPRGTAPQHARETLCDPGGGSETARVRRGGGAGGREGGRAGEPDRGSGAPQPGGPDAPGSPGSGAPGLGGPDDVLDDVLELPDDALEDLGVE